MSEFLQDVKKEKTRIFYIKRAQHVLKKLNEPLDNYKYFVSHFDDVINFLKEKKTNSGLHVYCIAISRIIPYLDISDNKKQEYKQKYLDIANTANKIVKNKNKPLFKKEIKNVLNDKTQYVVEEEEKEPITVKTVIENKPETRKSTRILEQKENKNVYKNEEETKLKFRTVKKVQHNSVEEE